MTVSESYFVFMFMKMVQSFIVGTVGVSSMIAVPGLLGSIYIRFIFAALLVPAVFRLVHSLSVPYDGGD